jgi:hypothetical protein
MMMDRPARDQLSRNLRLLVSGKISNDQFEIGYPKTKDAAVVAIADMAWLLYSDMKEHRLVGRHAIEPSSRREVLRWILFLDSDFEYVWPEIRLAGLHPSRRVRPVRWNSSQVSAEAAAQFLAAGDYAAWPFMSRSQYKHALKHPRRFAGHARSAPVAG